MVSLTAVVDKLTAACKECSEIWADIGMTNDEIEVKRQEFLKLVLNFADEFCARQKNLVAELNNNLETYVFKILDIGRQLGQSIAIPDAPSKKKQLQIITEIYERYTKILQDHKERYASLAKELAYLLEGLGDEASLASLRELQENVGVYDSKLIISIEKQIAEAKELSYKPIQRIQQYLNSIESINVLLQRDLKQYVTELNDSIMIDVLNGNLRPKYEEHVKSVLYQLESVAKHRAKEIGQIKVEISDVLSLLQSSGSINSLNPLSIVSAEAQACLQSENDISDHVVDVLTRELANLKKMRLDQLPKIIISLKREIYNSKKEIFGALGQEICEDGSTANQSDILKEPPSEEMLISLENELKRIRRIEEHCEPICMAIRRYNEVVALQTELKQIMSDTTRLTSKSREAARIRHHEEELKKEIQHLLPKTLAALHLKLKELPTALPPDVLNQLRDGDPNKPILFFGRDYEKELAAQLNTKDTKMIRKYEMYFVAYRRNSSNIEILKLRDGEDKPVKRQSIIPFKPVVFPTTCGSASASACGSYDASALSAAESADEQGQSDLASDLTMDALQSGAQEPIESQQKPSLKRSTKVARSKGVEASLGPEKVRMKPSIAQRSASSSSVNRGNVKGVGIKSKRIPKP